MFKQELKVNYLQLVKIKNKKTINHKLVQKRNELIKILLFYIIYYNFIFISTQINSNIYLIFYLKKTIYIYVDGNIQYAGTLFSI